MYFNFNRNFSTIQIIGIRIIDTSRFGRAVQKCLQGGEEDPVNKVSDKWSIDQNVVL